MINFHFFLSRARKLIPNVKPGSFFILNALGGELRRKANGWIVKHSFDSKPTKYDDNEAAICLAAASFVCARRLRETILLP